MRVLWSLGLVRGLMSALIGAGVGAGITMLVRTAIGLPAWRAEPVVVAAILVGLVAYFIGLGTFNYWFRWAMGAEVEEEHHQNAHSGYHWTRFFSFDINHKVIGIQYTVTALIVLIAAGLASIIMRLELAGSGQQVMGFRLYNTVMSFHGISMIAFTLIINAAIANLLLPLMIGARDMVFPRLNGWSYWFIPPAVLLLIAAVFAGGWETGWTGYPPLSAKGPLGQILMFLAVYLVGTSSILGAINFIATIIKSRAPGMGFFRLPILVWTFFASALLSLGFTQFIGMSFLLVVFEMLFGMGFFTPEKGGAPVLFQHLFWFYSHPAVYIMIFPWWGVVSEILPVFARKPLFAYRALILIGVLGVLVLSPTVWVHHMYPAGVGDVLRVVHMYTTELISVPTGFFFLAWLGTLWMGKLVFPTPMLFALTFVPVFLIGGLTGIPNASVLTDLYLHDTYWVTAHFHSTLGGLVFSVMAAFYFWFPKFTGRMYHEGLGRLHWVTMTAGYLLVTVSMFWLGLMGMRRRVADYDPTAGFEHVNLVATIGALIVAVSVVVFVVNVVQSLLRGARAPANPWQSRTLEWQVSSPPPEDNFVGVPRVLGSPYPYGVPGAVHALLPVAGSSGGGE